MRAASETGSSQDRDRVGSGDGECSRTATCLMAGRGQGGLMVRAALMTW